MAYYDKNETLAQALLDAVVAQYALDEIDLPGLQLLGYAGMPLSVDMLGVQLVRMYGASRTEGPSAEGQYSHREPLWRGAEFDIVLIRCTPQPKALPTGNITGPRRSVIEAFSRVVLRDPLIMTRGILTALKAGGFGGVPNLAFLDSASIADESGGIVGIRLRVRIGSVL